MKFNVLLVCTGNTCRSPMAEGLLRHSLPQSLRTITNVSSAGSMGSGAPATVYAVQVCREIGVDISRHRSQKISDEMIHEADLILTMTAGHRESVLFLDPRAHTKTFQLADYAGAGSRDVDDPIGGDQQQYRQTRDELLQYIRAIIPRLETLIPKA